MRMKDSDTPIQRKCSQCEEEEVMQRKEVKGIPNIQADFNKRLQATKGSGSPINVNTRQFMESRMGADFSNVRIHTGNMPEKMNRDISARAFTHGANIYFNRNEYQPESNTGKKLLAHELTHTIQQKGSGELIQRDLYRHQRIHRGSRTVGPGITIRWTGRSLRISASMELTGPEATTELASQIESTIETIWNATFSDGYEVSCSVDLTVRDENTEADSGKTQIFAVNESGPSHVTRHWVIGSRYLQHNVANADVNWTPAHEFGHLLGLDDRYSEGVISKISGRFGGERTTEVEPGWDGNIMAVSGGVLEQRNIEDLFALYAYELITIVEDMADQAAREYGRIEDAMRRGWVPFR
jgi:hypothetical protein